MNEHAPTTPPTETAAELATAEAYRDRYADRYMAGETGAFVVDSILHHARQAIELKERLRAQERPSQTAGIPRELQFAAGHKIRRV